jgi:uncharacterized membrane protein YjfL (UPF0719 family)
MIGLATVAYYLVMLLVVVYIGKFIYDMVQEYKEKKKVQQK